MIKAGKGKTVLVVAGIIFFIGAFALWTMSLSKRPILPSSSVGFDIVLEDASGLQPGSPIRAAGLNIGTIDSLELQRQDSGEILVLAKASIQRRYLDALKGRVVATLGSVGILGDRFVGLTPAAESSSGAVELAEGARIVAQQTLSMDKLTKLAGGVIENLQNVSVKLNTVLDSTTTSMANISAASKDGAVLVRKLRQGEGTIGALLQDRSIYDNVAAFTGAGDNRFITKSIEDVAIPPKVVH